MLHAIGQHVTSPVLAAKCLVRSSSWAAYVDCQFVCRMRSRSTLRRQCWPRNVWRHPHLGRRMCSVSLNVTCDRAARYLASAGREMFGEIFILGGVCAVSVFMWHAISQLVNSKVLAAKCLARSSSWAAYVQCQFECYMRSGSTLHRQCWARNVWRDFHLGRRMWSVSFDVAGNQTGR